MQDGFERILAHLPFTVREIHPDNGVEFFNARLLRFWQEKVKVTLSRSRPYHKNDNRFVEENNFSLVRAYVGYGRLDTVEQTRLLNCLYDKLWLYRNFFQPVLRLKEKRFLPADQLHPARTRRLYHHARPSTACVTFRRSRPTNKPNYRPCVRTRTRLPCARKSKR